MAPHSIARLPARHFHTALLQRCQPLFARLGAQTWLQRLPLAFVHYPLCSTYRFELANEAA